MNIRWVSSQRDDWDCCAGLSTSYTGSRSIAITIAVVAVRKMGIGTVALAKRIFLQYDMWICEALSPEIGSVDPLRPLSGFVAPGTSPR
jgi:hypothetical protein